MVQQIQFVLEKNQLGVWVVAQSQPYKQETTNSISGAAYMHQMQP